MVSPKIAHLVLGMPMGGTERLVERMVRKPPAPFHATCICLDLVGDLGDDLRRDGFDVVQIRRQPGFDWSLPLRLAAHTRRQHIDILHCHQYTPWFYGALARIFHPRLKILFTEHGRFYPDLPSWKRRIVNRVLAPLTSCMTAVSPAVREALVRVEAFPENRIRVVYNGIPDLVESREFPPGEKKPWRQKLGLRADWRYFILCARFDSIKWIPGLVQAFAVVAREVPECGLILVGDGPEAGKIRATIQALQLESRVCLPGFQHNIAEWLQAADVFVLSSLSEGTSVSLIESMAMGLPSVVTRVGGNVHVVEDGVTGLWVPAENAEALGQAMLSLMRRSDLGVSLGAAARRAFEARFRLELMFDTYRGIYENLLGMQAK